MGRSLHDDSLRPTKTERQIDRPSPRQLLNGKPGTGRQKHLPQVAANGIG